MSAEDELTWVPSRTERVLPSRPSTLTHPAFVTAEFGGKSRSVHQWLESGATVVISSGTGAVARSTWPNSSPPEEHPTLGGRLHLDREGQKILWGASDLRLTRTELQVLAALMERPWRVWQYAELNAAVWRDTYCGDTDRIRSAIKRLRSKFRAVGAEVEIEAVRGVGFRLAGTKRVGFPRQRDRVIPSYR